MSTNEYLIEYKDAESPISNVIQQADGKVKIMFLGQTPPVTANKGDGGYYTINVDGQQFRSKDIKKLATKYHERHLANLTEEVCGVGGGAIAGAGVGPQGEPGVSPKSTPKNAKYRAVAQLLDMVRRKKS